MFRTTIMFSELLVFYWTNISFYYKPLFLEVVMCGAQSETLIIVQNESDFSKFER